MKGNIGLFISCGIDINLNVILIDGVKVEGRNVGTSTAIQDKQQDKQGAAAIGLMITGSRNVTMSRVTIENITSENGTAKKIEILSSQNVVTKS